MNLYNITDYSDDYADTTGYLHHYKRSDQTRDADGTVNIADNSTSFNYQ